MSDDDTPQPGQPRSTQENFAEISEHLRRIESASKRRLQLWLSVAGGVVALIVGLTTLGIVWPWQAASRADVQVKADRVELQRATEANDAKHELTDKAVTTLKNEIPPMRKDLTVVKCILMARNPREKSNCALVEP